MNSIYKYPLLTIICLITTFAFADVNIDSLENYTIKSDGKEKIESLISLSDYYQSSDYKKSLSHAKNALKLSTNLKYKLGIAKAKNNIGYSLTDLGEFNEALDNYQECIFIFKELKEENRVAIAYNDMAYIFQSQGLVEKAIENYIKSLKLLEKLNDKPSIAACLNNIGLLYQDQKNYSKALEYYKKSLNTKEDLGNEKSIAVSLNNIGSLYFDQDKFIEAEEFFFKSLTKRKKINDKQGIAQSLTNLAALSRKQKQYTTSLTYLTQAHAIQLEINDNIGIINTMSSIGYIYILQNKPEKAKDILETSYQLAKEIGSPALIKDATAGLSSVYKDLNQYEKAYPLIIEHYRMSDSILNVDNSRKLTQIGLQYEFEKKLHKNELAQVKKNLEHEIEIKDQKFITYSFAIGLGALIILTIVILKALNAKKIANQKITKQKIEIEEKSDKLELALENITDSVKYAKRIQQALLQEEKQTSKLFPKHFIYFKPKDIVSGDFYWSYEKEDFFYIAAVDCTGHGVPGAFMSMLGISFLNNINSQKTILSPAEILNELRSKVIEELHQTNKDWSSRDGMDISLVRINTKNLSIEWAGANNSLIIITNENLTEIKANRFAINYSENLEPFTNHKFQLKKDDQIYLFTDGYADQFGGEKEKKFKYNNLKALLLKIAQEPLGKQKDILSNTFNNWMGNLDQIDDVCIIGLKI